MPAAYGQSEREVVKGGPSSDERVEQAFLTVDRVNALGIRDASRRGRSVLWVISLLAGTGGGTAVDEGNHAGTLTMGLVPDFPWLERRLWRSGFAASPFPGLAADNSKSSV
jgi:hypothetical protein